MSTATYTLESFANCKRDAVNYAIKDALGLDETANLRKRLIQLAAQSEDGEGEEVDPQIVAFGNALKAREKSLRKNGDVYELGMILNIDPDAIDKRKVKETVKKERGLTRVQKAFYGVFKRFARKDFVMQSVAFEAARSCSFKTALQIGQAHEVIDAKESLIGGCADQVFGMTATFPVGNNITAAYGDTDSLEQWLLEVYPSYLHKVPHGFDWHTEKAWRDAAHNVSQHVESVEAA